MKEQNMIDRKSNFFLRDSEGGFEVLVVTKVVGDKRAVSDFGF